MIKKAATDHAVHELIVNRWSPYRFDDKAISNKDLLSLFEAARWAPSSYNEQPWRFLIATKDRPAEFNTLLACLQEGNQAWAQHASALVLASSRLTFERNGEDNQAAIHDLGAAVSYLSLEAASRGIAVHQMIGIDPAKAKRAYRIPEDYRILTAFAIGYPDSSATDEDLYSQRDNTPRARKKIAEFLYQKEWEHPSEITQDF